MRGYGMIDVNMPGWLEKEKPVAGSMDAIVRPIAVAPCSSDTDRKSTRLNSSHSAKSRMPSSA